MADHNAKLTWKQGMTFEGYTDGKSHLPTVFASGSENLAEYDNGHSPLAMVLLALAGCTAMDVISILKKKKQDIAAFEIEVEGDQVDEHPRVYNHITIVYKLWGKDLSEEAVARAIELSETKYCSVNGMLKLGAKIDYRFEINQPEPQM
ncbi:MAG: OsmC family protein [Chloroflexi bacterium]|nr:OsmC family protein [Chloroflexota bacterium]